MEKNSKKILTKELGEQANDLAKISLGGIAMATSTILAVFGCKVLCFMALLAMIIGLVVRL